MFELNESHQRDTINDAPTDFFVISHKGLYQLFRIGRITKPV